MSKKSIKSDLARIDQIKDAEINYSDIPPLDKSFLKRATIQQFENDYGIMTMLAKEFSP